MALNLTSITHNQILKLPSEAQRFYVHGHYKMCWSPADDILSRLTLAAPVLTTALDRNWETAEMWTPGDLGYWIFWVVKYLWLTTDCQNHFSADNLICKDISDTEEPVLHTRDLSATPVEISKSKKPVTCLENSILLWDRFFCDSSELGT